MKHLPYLAFVFIIGAVSCKKAEIKDVEKAGDRIVGSWHVDEIILHTTDTLGSTIGADVSLKDQGDIIFNHGDKSAIGAAYFDYASFTGACANSELVQYFSIKAAGDAISNGWVLSWDADPDDLRVQFWAETSGGSYHRSLNHNYDGPGQQLFYVLQPLNQNLRQFYTWKLSKR